MFGEDVTRGKPDPECYRCACEQLAVVPAECVVVEDAVVGIAAARAAGCRVIAIASTESAAALVDAEEICDTLPQLATRLRTLLSRRG